MHSAEMKSAERNRLKDLLRDTITLLCKNGLSYKESFSIEALIGITLDDSHVFLVNINESVQTDFHAEDKENSEVVTDYNEDPSDASIEQDKAADNNDMVTSGHKRQLLKSNRSDIEGTVSPKKKLRNVKSPKKHNKKDDYVHDSSDEELLFVKEEIGSLTSIDDSTLCHNSEDSVLQGIAQSANVAESPWTSYARWPIPSAHESQRHYKKQQPTKHLTVSNNLWSKSPSLVSSSINIRPTSTDSELVIQRPKRVFSCHIPECQQQFFTKRNLTGHLWRKHQIGEPTICKCGQVFAYKNKFYVHRKTCPDAQFSMANGSVHTTNGSVTVDAPTSEEFSREEDRDFSKNKSSVTAGDACINGTNISTAADEQNIFRICNSRSLKDSDKEVEDDEDSQYMNLETL